MSRHILCLPCGSKPALAPEDEKRGWTFRKVFVSLRQETPPTHGYKLDGVFTHEEEYRCDLCNEYLNGKIGVALSRIPPDMEMAVWETDYGTLLPEEAVKTYDSIKNK